MQAVRLHFAWREFHQPTERNGLITNGGLIMSTVIIGLGNIGARLARNLTVGGQKIIVADRTLAKARTLAGELGPNAEALPIADAIGKAEVLVLAVPFDAIRAFIAEHRDRLTGKIIVDPSNPITPDGKGGFRKIIPVEQSAGQIISNLLSAGVQLVKAFGTLGAESLGSCANRAPDRAVLFYATDHPAAGDVIARLITASGFSAISVGGIDKSIRIEVGGDLHEFGKLGRPVSVREAEALI
jgi:predicted dinucleotide-binding enzyme